MKASDRVVRIAPLRVLEYLQVLAGAPVWRCGDRMKNEINRRKTVIYAVHRRAVEGNVTVAEAIAELEASCTKQGKVMGVSAMATALTKKAECEKLGIPVEASPSQFEKDGRVFVPLPEWQELHE